MTVSGACWCHAPSSCAMRAFTELLPMSKRVPYILPRQRGAALVIGLMLLVILTLLAVTGMNTASTELAMAGNEQYQLKAIQASQTGVEQALTVVGTNAGPATNTANASV